MLLLTLLVLKQNLPHLGSPLPQCLRRLLAGSIVANLEPKSELLVLLEEPSVHLANRTHDRARDGGLVVLTGLEVRATVGVDEVAEAAVAGVDVCPASAAAEDVVAGVEFDTLFGGEDDSELLDRGGGGVRCRLLIIVVAGSSCIGTGDGSAGVVGLERQHVGGGGVTKVGTLGGRRLNVLEVVHVHGTLAHHLGHGLSLGVHVHSLGIRSVVGREVGEGANAPSGVAAASVGSLAVRAHHVHHILGVVGHVAHHSWELRHEGHWIHLAASEGGGGVVEVHSSTVVVDRAVIAGGAEVVHVVIHLLHVGKDEIGYA
mmetsp:Transcript_24221/g.52240  ORF Transcript_24221/g.52240 Transcript_24221/m.52240 type:complete len:316 (-) Transcript_24221:87-1034(-)